MRKRLLMGIFLTVCALTMGKNMVSAADIVIDGDYSEWNAADMINTTGLFFQKISVKVSGDILYIYAKENARNPWENYYTYTTPVLVTSEGKEITLRLWADGQQGDTTRIIVRNQSYVQIEGAEGIRTKNGTYEWELAIPLQEFGTIEKVKMMMDYSTYEVFDPIVMGSDDIDPTDPTDESDTDDSKVEETDPTEDTDVDIVEPSATGIIIDGTFEDWNTYPHTLVTNWNMPEEQRTEGNCRSIGMAYDDENLYFHIKMLSDWHDPYNGNMYIITADGYTVKIYVMGEDGTVFPSGTRMKPGEYNIVCYYKAGTPNVGDMMPIDEADAILTVSEDRPDEAEFKLPLEIFKVAHGMDYSDIKEITIGNPNLFDHSISSAGSSTGPVVGVTLCIAASAGIGVIYKKKKVKK